MSARSNPKRCTSSGQHSSPDAGSTDRKRKCDVNRLMTRASSVTNCSTNSTLGDCQPQLHPVRSRSASSPVCDGLQVVTFGSGDSIYIPNFLTPPQAATMLLRLRTELVYVPREVMTFSIFGKPPIPLPRSKMFLCDVYADGSKPRYKYDSSNVDMSVSWTPTVKQIRDRLASYDYQTEQARIIANQYNNHCVVNSYSLPTDKITAHRDKTPSWFTGSQVMTVSLGSPRVMNISRQGRIVQRINVQPGSLVVIGWETNKAYKHEIKQGGTGCEERISLTFRSIQLRRLIDGGETREPPAEWHALLQATSPAG